MSDEDYMRLALACARRGAQMGEVPVGAVLVSGGEVIAEGWNQPITACDPSAHAEMLVLRAGAQRQNNYRILDTTLYVTLEPCAMCVTAMVHARVKRVVWGAPDPKTGMAISQMNLFVHPAMNWRIEVVGGVLAEECGQLLSGFFQARRAAKKAAKGGSGTED
ncbi:MAG: tRNA adenosine(34) deaminase TadA [Gammaproteobacteria bacterium]|nr:tRNA adenosine(34) deaminase TadA [Gammaproteobacteria bacterium]